MIWVPGRNRNYNIDLYNMIQSLHVVKNLDYGNLRLEILDSKSINDNEFINLSDAISGKEITITEIDESGSVPNLYCKNNGDKLILVLAGEEIVGAKQNRITNVSFIIPPKSEITIPVSCVEEGRWNYKSKNFSKGMHAYSDLKRKLYQDVSACSIDGGGYGSDQSNIWSDIREKQRVLKKHSTTNAMNDMYDNSKYLDNFLLKNKDIEGVGMVAFINGSVASIEILPNNIFFKGIFSDLVKSLYQESLLYKNSDRTYSKFFSTNHFLNTLRLSKNHRNEGVGLGHNNRLESIKIGGDYLKYESNIIHLYAFPNNVNRIYS